MQNTLRLFRGTPGRGRALLAGALLVTLSLPAIAHETWLLPDSFAPPAGQRLGFTLRSGMGFPDDGAGIDPSRIVAATLTQGNASQALVPGGSSDHALELSAAPGGGVACAMVSLKPRILEMDAADRVEHYLDEIGAPESVWAAWEASKDSVAWRESYGKLARSYFAASADGEVAPCWQDGGNARFDIVPLDDPTTLAVGDTLALKVMFDGKPLAGQAIGFVREGASPEPLRRSDGSGRVEVQVAGEGRHMVYATKLRRVSNDDFAWESDFVTLTFSVQAP